MWEFFSELLASLCLSGLILVDAPTKYIVASSCVLLCLVIRHSAKEIVDGKEE